MTAGSHASTFGGNPLAMAVAAEVLATVTAPGFLETVRATGDRLAAGLDALVAARPHLFEARRGMGLMQGLRCRTDPAVVVAAFRDAGLVTAPAQDRVVRLLPPLIVSDAEVDEALAIMDGVGARMRLAA
jgi:acetylornithine/N-succinyldiaminopimelate aminotransferase